MQQEGESHIHTYIHTARAYKLYTHTYICRELRRGLCQGVGQVQTRFSGGKLRPDLLVQGGTDEHTHLGRTRESPFHSYTEAFYKYNMNIQLK